MYATALFIGGPWDGQVRALSSARPEVNVWEYDADLDLARDLKPSDLPEAISVTTRTYYRTRVLVFGEPVYVWVFEGLSPSEYLRLGAEHILRPWMSRLALEPADEEVRDAA